MNDLAQASQAHLAGNCVSIQSAASKQYWFSDKQKLYSASETTQLGIVVSGVRRTNKVNARRPRSVLG